MMASSSESSSELLDDKVIASEDSKSRVKREGEVNMGGGEVADERDRVGKRKSGSEKEKEKEKEIVKGREVVGEWIEIMEKGSSK